MRHALHLSTIPVILLALCVSLVDAAPSFGTAIIRHQPDGTAIILHLWGDEFGLVAETADGYTVVRDADGSWCYARPSADGGRLESTGLRVGSADPRAIIGLVPHVRIDAGLARAQRRARQAAAGIRTDGGGHWVRRQPSSSARSSPPARTTVGDFTGLCLLIDFADAPGAIARSEIDNAMNQIGYTGMGNSRSMRGYFRDVSGGRVDYTNVLPATTVWVTGYYRATRTKTYYNDRSIPFGVRAQELIREALADLKARDPSIFDQLTYDATGAAFALNVLYAGDRPDDDGWSTGLWPHMSMLATDFAVGNGRVISYYQISDMPDPLPLGTICHENGHLLCDFPDLYDYDTWAQPTPVGAWCLMGSGGYGGPPGYAGFAPTGVCGYLRWKAGWTTAVDLDLGQGGTVCTAQAITGSAAGGNVFRIRKNATEYFLLENRDTSGVDAWLPGAGLAIYHVDERGSNAHHTTSATGRWECVLVQADNGDALLTGASFFGTSQMPFSAATGRDRFSYLTTPAAVFYDRKPSAVVVTDISGPGTTMTFTVAAGPGWIESVSTADDGSSSHCGSGGGLTAMGIMLPFAVLAFMRRRQP